MNINEHVKTLSPEHRIAFEAAAFAVHCGKKMVDGTAVAAMYAYIMTTPIAGDCAKVGGVLARAFEIHSAAVRNEMN